MRALFVRETSSSARKVRKIMQKGSRNFAAATRVTVIRSARSKFWHPKNEIVSRKKEDEKKKNRKKKIIHDDLIHETRHHPSHVTADTQPSVRREKICECEHPTRKPTSSQDLQRNGHFWLVVLPPCVFLVESPSRISPFPFCVCCRSQSCS